MKKFTKILSRRTRDDSPSSGSNGHTYAPPLYEAPTVHQLSSSRVVGSLRAAPPPSTHIVADSEHDIVCDRCRAADFPLLFNWRPGQPRPWVGLSHLLGGQGETATCPYCIFFRALLGEAGDAASAPAGKFSPYLRIRLAFERMGVGEMHELGREVLIEVMGRNKSLPWGHVVRAADPSLDGYWEAEGIRGRAVPPFLDVEVPRSWIRFCRQAHVDDESCSARQKPVAGLRLVDVRTRSVVAVEDLADSDRLDYVALSYVWGRGRETNGSSASKPEDHLGPDGKVPDHAPPLMADALRLTDSLGFRYLWVDRYCFFQLPGDQRRRQLDSMGDIYARSALTLIVAAGAGVGDGIPGVSVPRGPQLSIQTGAGLFTTSLPRPDLEVAQSKWASRCWTYQEGLLSRRRLVLTPSQAYFQCGGGVHCHESVAVPLRLTHDIDLGRVFPAGGAGAGIEDLDDRIGAYMSKDLSAPEERHDAFRGIIRHFGAIDTLVGLPLPDPDDFAATHRVVSQTDRLAVSLGWRASGPCALQGPAHLFPSWTWLSWRPGAGRRCRFRAWPAAELADVAAPPEMEMSVGFEDGAVLSWEIDGDAIARRSEGAVRFLRVRSYLFGMVYDDDGGLAGAELGDERAEVVAGWCRAATAAVGGAGGGALKLTAVLVSGRNWRGGEGSWPREATVLVCRCDGAARLVRLGVLTLPYAELRRVDDEAAVMAGVELPDGERRQINVELREVDIY